MFNNKTIRPLIHLFKFAFGLGTKYVPVFLQLPKLTITRIMTESIYKSDAKYSVVISLYTTFHYCFYSLSNCFFLYSAELKTRIVVVITYQGYDSKPRIERTMVHKDI